MGEKKKTKKKKNRKAGRIFKVIALIILFLTLTAAVGGGGFIYAVVKSAPPLDVKEILNLEQISKIYDDKGEYIDDVPTDVKRDVVPISKIPKNLQEAFISIEDERFRSHNGVDPRRILGALYVDIKKIITRESGLHGASTITQQLLKNTILTDKVSITRKVQEMYLALKLEKMLSKDQILQAYLNTIPLGSTTYGVEAASQYYFNKSVDKLDLLECAYIAGVTQSTDLYNALTERSQKNPTPYLNRTKTVLGKMKENGKISAEEYDTSINAINDGTFQKKFADTIAQRKSENPNKLNFEWFSRPVIKQVKSHLKDKYKYTDAEVDKMLLNGGLQIYTTMNKELQEHTQAVINDDKILGVKSYVDKNNIIQPQASAVVMDYRTGQVKAIVGGRGNQPPGSYNRAADLKKFPRPAGSALKPLTVYAPAIDTKFATAGSVFEDSPLTGSAAKAFPSDPQNDNRKYRGYVTVREALKYSINLVAIKMEHEMGVKTGSAYAEKFGIDFSSKPEEKEQLAPLALGEFYGTNTYHMAAAFGTFGNNGIYTEPVMYTKVVDKYGKVLLEGTPQQRPVISPQTAYIMYDMLKGPIKFSATRAPFGSMPVAGKTGTSGGSKNLWFSGLTPHLSAAVWIGSDKPETIISSSGRTLNSNAPAYVWGQIMKKAHEGLSTEDIKPPSGLVKASVCNVSGLLPTEMCKIGHNGSSSVVTDYFIEGTVPTSLCDVHVEAEVNTSNNKLATENTPSHLRAKKVFIKRDYKPSKPLGDQQYVLPTEKDDTLPAPVIPTPTPAPSTPVTPPPGGATPPPPGPGSGGQPPNPGNTDTPPAEEGEGEGQE